MCEETMDNVKKHCGSNAPNLKQRVYATSAPEVDTIPNPTANSKSNSITTDIIMRQEDAAATPPVAAGLFYDWKVAKANSSYKSVKDDNGMWNTEVKFFIPRITGPKSYILTNTGEDNHIVIAPDKNGVLHLVGETDNPADIKVEETTTPKNGYNVTVTHSGSHAPYKYEGVIPT